MIEYMCEGCKKVKDLQCTVYAEPPRLYAIRQHCPVNTILCNKPKARRRVGQQKQKRKR